MATITAQLLESHSRRVTSATRPQASLQLDIGPARTYGPARAAAQNQAPRAERVNTNGDLFKRL